MKKQFVTTLAVCMILFSASMMERSNCQHSSYGTETYSQITSSYQEGAAIYTKNNKKGLVNTYGYAITAAIYDSIRFHQRLCRC